MELIAKKYKIEVVWTRLRATELVTIMNLVGNVPNSNPFFSMTHLDPETNTYRTGTFYLNADSNFEVDVGVNPLTYKEVSMTFIEK
jgi:hypothetical protein